MSDYQTVLAEYREQFPLLANYLDVLEETRPAEPKPITEPQPGIYVMEATRIACHKAGYTITHADQYLWAYKQIEALLDEVRSVADMPLPTLDQTIISHYFSLMGCIPTPDEWLSWIEEDKADDAREWVESITSNPKLLADLAYLAMPELLRLTIARDARERGIE